MDDPSPKRIKLDNCLICNKESHVTDRKEVYSELLLTHLVPPSSRKHATVITKTFDYCVDCVELMEDMCRLQEGLDFILNSLKQKVELIKFSMLKNSQWNNGSSGDSCIDRFRRMAVNEFYPVVKMNKNNALLEGSNGKKTYDMVKERQDASSSSSSPISLITESGTDKDSVISQEDSVLKIVPIPRPFQTENENVGTKSRIEEDKDSRNNIEDSIIVIAEPPKFDKSQAHIYFESYRDMHKCKFCHMIIKGGNQMSLSRHINVVHANNSRFKCGVCFAIFFSRSKCRSHINETHLEALNKNTVTSEEVHPISSVSSGTSQTQGYNSDSSNSPSENSVHSEIVINMDPKSSYNLMEDVVKFEPWGATSTEESIDPLESKSPESPSNCSPSQGYDEESQHFNVDRQESMQVESSDETNKVWEKPKLSYVHLAVLAIKNCKTKDKCLPFPSICRFLKDYFPWFKTDTVNWGSDLKQALVTEYFKSKKETNSTNRRYGVYERKIDKIRESIRESCTNSVNAMAHPGELEKLRNAVLTGASEKGSSEKSVQDSFEDPGFEIVEHTVDLDKLETKAERIYSQDRLAKEKTHNISDKIYTSERHDKLSTNCNIVTVVKPQEKHKRTDEVISKSNKSDWSSPNEHVFLRPCLNPDKTDHGRPPFTYTHLSFLAINSSSSKSLKISEIHNFIKEVFPFFNSYQANWKNSLYLCLKTNDCFKLIKLDAVHSRQVRLPSRFAWTVADPEEESIVNIKSEIQNLIKSSALSIFESIGNHENLEGILKKAVGEDVDYDFVAKERKSYLNALKRQESPPRPASKKKRVASRRVSEPEPEEVLPDTVEEEVLPDSIEEEEQVPQQQQSVTIYTPLPMYNIVVPMTMTPLHSEIENRKWAKPNISYEYLAILAIKNIGNMLNFVSLPEILEFIKDNFPWFHLHDLHENLEIPWIKDIVKALSTNYFTWKLDESSVNGAIKVEKDLERARHYAVVEINLEEVKHTIGTILSENINSLRYPENIDTMVSNVIGSQYFSTTYQQQESEQHDIKVVSTESMQQAEYKQEIDIVEEQPQETNHLPLTFLAPVGYAPNGDVVMRRVPK